ncbi:MAG: DUF4115 domain-containing protein [Ignavibacterium sp.]|nr:DUF4115 domain-containing protein [Ignavibacterium sp.]
MIDIGKNLKELRLRKGLTLHQISEITKINLKYLEYLEENNFNFLPEVYVRSFLKTYLKALDENEKEYLETLTEILHPSEQVSSPIESKSVLEETKKTDTKLKASNKFLIGKSNIITAKNIGFLLLALIVLIGIIFLLITRSENQEPIKTQNSEETMYQEVQEKSKKFDNIASSDSLELGIIAKDSVWIQVKMDELAVEEAYLRNGDVKKFKAKNEFNILIGNAGAVSFQLNNNELPFTGVKGSVRRVKIDKNGIHLIQGKNEPKKQQ